MTDLHIFLLSRNVQNQRVSRSSVVKGGVVSLTGAAPIETGQADVQARQVILGLFSDPYVQKQR